MKRGRTLQSGGMVKRSDIVKRGYIIKKRLPLLAAASVYYWLINLEHKKNVSKSLIDLKLIHWVRFQ